MGKNKNNFIAVGVVVAVVAALLGFYFLSNSNTPQTEEKQVAENVVQTIKPEDIGFKLQASADKKKVHFSIAKAQGIQAIEYQMMYDADSTAQEKSEGGDDRVQRGITGEVAIKPGSGTFTSEDLDLGSCSKNVCRYDKGVTSIDVTLKITKTDGKVYDLQDTLTL